MIEKGSFQISEIFFPFTSHKEIQDFDLKSGATFWSEAGTHIAINNGNKPAKAYLIEVK